MPRATAVVLVGVLLAAAGPARAADVDLAGNWKFSLPLQGQLVTFWLIHFEKKDGQWAGSIPASHPGVPKGASVDKVEVTPDALRFVLHSNLQNIGDFSFAGKLPPDKDQKILGTIARGAQVDLFALSHTRLKTLDPLEVNKEILAESKAGPELFNAALLLLGLAPAKKVPLSEARGWSNKAFSAAAAYGPRLQQEFALRIAQAALPHAAFAPLAVEYARKAERLSEPGEDWRRQLRVLDVLADALRKTNKPDEAKEAQAKSDQLYAKHMQPFPAEKYAGRKAKSERAALVELFTGAQCNPCVAADVAFDALGKTYGPADVVLLEYHLSVPAPDPLTNEDAEARSKYYSDEIEGTPTILFDGKLKPRTGQGGTLEAAKDKHQAYVEAINPLLEQPTSIKLKARAARKGDKIDISAEVSGLETTGDKIRLRLALTEDVVRYAGSNGIRLHHHVVRAMPGGAEGMPLKEKAGKQEITVDLQHLRESLEKQLPKAFRQQPDSAKRLLDFQKLHVVAFVQNDETKEVLQAVQVPVTGENAAQE
jgi:hypothetical protein